MDCLRAQQLVSDALDRVPLDSNELEAAKVHCRDCSECSAFVRAQLAVQRAGMPQVPQDLPHRIMAAVSSQAEIAALGSTPDTEGASTEVRPATAAADPTRSEVTPDKASPATSWGELLSRAWEPRNRRRFVAWSAAATALFVVAAFGAIAGVRTILVPPPVDMRAMTESAGESALAPDEEFESSAGATADSSAPSATEAAAPSFITLEGWVYRLKGPAAGVDESSLDRVGATRSSLSADGAPRTRRALGTAGAATVYIEGDSGELLGFDLVTRSYGGRTYGLQSRQINTFSEWPALPQGFREPSSADGSPTFTEDGTDDGGTTIYRLRSSTAEEGIAVAPNPPAPDPIAGAPNWTWWAPRQP